MRVAGEDGSDVRSGFVDQFGERSACCDFLFQSGAFGRTGSGAVVVLHNDQVCQVLSLDFCRHPVDGFHGVPKLKIGNSGRSYQGGNFLGDGADHSHAHPVHVQYLVLRQDRGGGAFLVDVRTQVGELRVGSSRDDSLVQVLPTAVELVVAHSGSLQLQCVEDIDGGLVLRH
ncbi:hypothetical protein PJL18_00652 [Paenarthrobacter nicotinovorans]|nr:hypothetical protein [Paenarthrobacter nicotinovorans]